MPKTVKAVLEKSESVKGRITALLMQQPTDTVLSTNEVLAAVKCGITMLKDAVHHLPQFTWSEGAGGKRWWGHPKAIAQLKTKES